LPLLLVIALDPVIDSPEYHLHEHGLWTHPSTEQPTEDDREENDEDYGRDKHQAEKEEVVWAEYLAEQDELPVWDVEEEQRMALNLDEGCTKENGKQNQAKSGPPSIVSSVWFLRIDPFSLSLLANDAE
jgi:hypothetical protein